MNVQSPLLSVRDLKVWFDIKRQGRDALDAVGHLEGCGRGRL